MSNPIIGADYAMCQKCGGWVAFHLSWDHKTVNAAFAKMWESKGFTIKRYRFGYNVPACDCPKEQDDVILGGGFAQ